MPLSSTLSETRLIPEPALRKLVLISGCLLLCCGSLLILILPVAASTRGLLLLLWLLDGMRELARLYQGSLRVTELVLDECGTITAINADGDRQALILLSGSVVLPRLAWLRLGFADKCHYGELIRGNADKDRQWQKFQLIWRQSAARFGCGG